MQDAPSMLPLQFLTLLAALAYAALALRQPRTGKAWPRWRTALFLTGCGLLMLGFSPQALPFAEDDFRKHMLQHLLLAMLAPIGLVMAAPVTLLLRTLRPSHGRVITGILRQPFVRAISSPVIALLLDLGAMALLYFSPLYEEMMLYPGLHLLVHVHFVAAGCLYTWVIAGPDPAPHRPSVPVRLLVLGVAVVLHSVLAQLLYAGWHVAVAVPVLQRHAAAELMYYGGDVTEMLLAFALVSTWQPQRTSQLPSAVTPV